MFHSESDISIIEYVLLSLLSFFLSSINWHKFKRLWAISFGFYCWYMIGNLQRSALEGLFRTAWLSACWSSSRLADIILSQTWVTYSLSNWVNFIILFDIMVHHENIVEQVGATMAIQPRWWLLTGKVSWSCLPVSQTHRVYTLVELLFLRNVIAGLLLTLFFKWYVWMSDSFIRHLCSVSIVLKLIGFLLFDWFR